MAIGGFVAIHRKIEQWPLWRTLTLGQRMVVFVLLLQANWRDSEAWIDGVCIPIKRGQLLAAERALADRAGVNRIVVRRALQNLEADGFLARGRAHAGAHAPTIITILNYDKYQTVDQVPSPDMSPEVSPRASPRASPIRTINKQETTTARARDVVVVQDQDQDQGPGPEYPLAAELRRRLLERFALTAGLKFNAQTGDVEAGVKRLGIERAFALCVEAGFAAQKREGRYPSTLGYFARVLEAKPEEMPSRWAAPVQRRDFSHYDENGVAVYKP